MENSKSEQDRNYAHWTFTTGTRTFEGVLMILDNTIKNFKEISSHSCGSFSSTYDVVARNAVSDTAIVMSYSLLEGFFHEEFEYYMKDKFFKKPKELSGLINTLLNEHKISLQDWKKRRTKIDLLRKLRNAVVHCNGAIEEIDKEKCKEVFGEDIFEDRGYPRFSLGGSIALITELKNIADEYAKAVFIGPNEA